MPSEMSGNNGRINQYYINKITNHSIIEINDGADQYPPSDFGHLKTNSVTMNNSIPSMQNLDQGISDFCTYLGQINSNEGFFDEYRLRLNSENLGQERPICCMRRANTMDGNLDFRSTQLGCDPSLFENVSHSNQDNYDEIKLRDICARDAQQLGFIVGDELEIVKAKSHRSVIQNTPDRITSSFKDRYGKSDPSSKKSYLQLGVRVPTKEHVSEIVGKQGSKIKQIREKTGALITTPGEQEDHVFIIEAPPRISLHVAQILKNRAEDITMCRSQDSRRRSSCPNNSNNIHSNKSPASSGLLQSNSKIILASGRIQVPKIIVGRIIGTQGSIITTIQRDTGTEIRSPPKEIGKPKHSLADFEIHVYQTANFTDVHEAKQRIVNAKQLIAHIVMHQLEKVRAEEAPYSNYQVQSSNTGNTKTDGNSPVKIENDQAQSPNKERLLTEQMRPFDWIWPDLPKLDDSLVSEVVDRILEESKKKTKTRSEPSIYDNSVNSLLALGESDTFTNRCADLNRPRHSLPETRVDTMQRNGLDLFYRSYLQSSQPYSVNDNFIRPETDMFFINRRELGSRTGITEHEMFDFKCHDFVDNQDYNSGCHLSTVRNVSEQMYLNRNDRAFNVSANRFCADKIGSPYSFPVENSHWNYRLNAPTKTYADSVRLVPASGATGISSSTHGTIGDHLKKPNNYKGQ